MNALWKTLLALSVVAALAGCEASGGDSSEFGGGFGGGGGDPGPGDPTDDDGDGVPNDRDLCPGTAEGATVDANGCSEDQYGDAIPSGFVCTAWRSGTATAGTSDGNLCGLGALLDPVLGILGTETCFVTDEQNAADGDSDTYATMTYTAALLDPASFGFESGTPLDGNVSITVSDFGSQNPGSVAAFDVEVPGGTVDLGVLSSIRVDTLLDGTVVESYEAASESSLDPIGLISLDLLGLVGGSGRFAAGFVASEPYNQIRITGSASLLGADVGLDSSEASLFVYDACSDAAAPPAE